MASQEPCSEIIFEILTRTRSLEALDTCKSVCKRWQHMIYESSFMPTYCERTKNVLGYIIQDIKNNKCVSTLVSIHQSENNARKNKVRVERLPCDMKILASSNQGILCCEKEIGRDYEYYVCKPTTKQCQKLPSPNFRYRTVSVAIMVLKSRPNLRYKILRLSCRGILEYRKQYCGYICEMFDSEIWTWMKQKDLILPYEELIIGKSNPVFARNSINCLTSDDNVVAFNQADNHFYKFRLPDPVRVNCSSYNHKRLLEYRGKLGFTCLTQGENYMDLWLIADSRYNRWTKTMSVNLVNLNRDVKFSAPAGFYNADIAFMKAYDEILFYKVRDGSYNMVKLDIKVCARDSFQFRSDSNLVNLQGSRFFKPRRSKK